MRAFVDSGKSGGSKLNPSLLELQQAIIRYVQKLPGNDRCCDCNSQNGEEQLIYFLILLSIMYHFVH
jgi:Arf-GAP/SH3 domain/ANK repeat/PH domain-containing protein